MTIVLEKSEDVVPCCGNCRNRETRLCYRMKYFKKLYYTKLKKQRGHGNDKRFSHPKEYCKWWAYDPNFSDNIFFRTII